MHDRSEFFVNKYTDDYKKYCICIHYNEFIKLFLIENEWSEKFKYKLVRNDKPFTNLHFVKGGLVKFNVK
jgi:hypothetical protein